MKIQIDIKTSAGKSLEHFPLELNPLDWPTIFFDEEKLAIMEGSETRGTVKMSKGDVMTLTLKD